MNRIIYTRNVNDVTKEEHTFFKKNILKIDQVQKIDKHKQLYAYKIKNRLFLRIHIRKIMSYTLHYYKFKVSTQLRK